MKVRHEICATHDISRKFNDIVNALDYIITYQLKNVDPETGSAWYTDLAALKADLVNNGVSLKAIKSAIATFITKRAITFDLSKYIDTNLITLNTKLTSADNFLTTTVTDVGKLNTIAKVVTLAQTLTNPTVNVSAVNYDKQTWYTNIINDLLDASSYVLHGITPEDGTPLSMTDTQKKERVRMYLNQIPQFIGLVSDPTLLTDCNDMKAKADYVLSHLDDTALNDLGTYIDTNVEKLPLLRRNWA